MTTRDLSRGPALRFPPVMLFIFGFAAGIIANVVRPLPVFGRSRYWLMAGVLLVGIAVILVAWACVLFLKRRTAIYPVARASALVVAGPYRLSRNPMYVAMAAAYAGFALAFHLLWALLLLPLVMLACYVLVIRREEAYLATEFGSAYTEYTRRVRRWL